MSRASDFEANLADVGIPIGNRRSLSGVPLRFSGVLAGSVDIAAITLWCVIANVAYKGVLGDVGDILPFVGIGFYSALFFVLLTHTSRLYSIPALASLSKQVRGISICWSVVIVGLLSSFFLLKVGADFSRGAMIIFGIGGGAVLFGLRLLASRQIVAGLERGTLSGKRAILIGTPDELKSLPGRKASEQYGATSLEYFHLSQDGAARDENDLKIVNDVIRSSISNRIELVLLLIPWTDDARLKAICERLRILPLQVLLLPDRVVNSMLSRPGEPFASAVAIEVQRAPLTGPELIVKRSFDVIFASLSLLALSPLLAMVAALIKLDSAGPIIFRQKRRGFNGREFSIFKFRTMSVIEDGEHVRQAERNDERLTRIGRALRRSSIDELPQLLNVLRGDMSVVGPRPHAVAHDSQYNRLIENYAFRHHVKPGITGWAQVHGLRGQTDRSLMQRRVDFDLWYINNWSLMLDIRIVARTFVEVARQRNAY